MATDTPLDVKLNRLDTFREINNTFPQTAQILDFKRQGKKVFGWLYTYVPEEIIHAAGALPIRITGYKQEMELEDGNAYLYVNNCSFSRSCLQMGLRGEYDYLDGIIAESTCDGARPQEMKIQYGYNDATGDYFITVDSGRCDGCGQCVTACAPIFVMAKDDSGQMKARVKEEARKKLSILCPGIKACTLKPNCHDACPRAAISHSW